MARSNWTVARSTEWTVRLALATSCAEACAESAASPARLDCMFEQFLTILSQPLMQLARSDLGLCGDGGTLRGLDRAAVQVGESTGRRPDA